jgi:hypothetical protein
MQLFRILQATHYHPYVKVLVLYSAIQPTNAGGYKMQVTLNEIMQEPANKRLYLHDTQMVKEWVDIGDDKLLGGIFSMIRKTYPSERLLLFTWDHGSGFGIFNNNPNDVERNRRFQEEIDAADPYAVKNYRGFQAEEIDAADILIDYHSGKRSLPLQGRRSFSNEAYHLQVITNENLKEVYSSRDVRKFEPGKKSRLQTSMLTNDELRNVIKSNSEGDKVDLLVMMNCMMQMIETGYALQDAADYLVAPETCIFWAGYDYISIINKLCSQPDIETEAIGKYTLDTIPAYYNATPFRREFNDLVVSLVKPGKSHSLTKKLDVISSEFCAQLPGLFHHLKNVRMHCEDLSQKYVSGLPYYYIDLMNFLTLACSENNNLRSGLEAVRTASKEYVVHLLKGENYNDNNSAGTDKINGYTIFFPPTAEDGEKDFYYKCFYKEEPNQTSFAGNAAWNVFLENYIITDKKNTPVPRKF